MIFFNRRLRVNVKPLDCFCLFLSLIFFTNLAAEARYVQHEIASKGVPDN